MAPPDRWSDFTVLALDRLGSGTEASVIQEVAVQFADRFERGDRGYVGTRPKWHESVSTAVAQLRSGGLLDGDSRLHLTELGYGQVADIRSRLDSAPAPVELAEPPDHPAAPILISGVISPPLRTVAGRASAQMRAADGTADAELALMIELNLAHKGGPSAAFRQLATLWRRINPRTELLRLGDEYATGTLTANEMKRLVAADATPIVWPERSIYRVWPDFPVHKLIDASIVTIKADAAHRSFNSFGDGIVWAVIDSGIARDHPHFAGYETLTHPSVKGLHRWFRADGRATRSGALTDEDGHGTHVAGVIAGGLQKWSGAPESVVVTESRYNVDNPGEPLRAPRQLLDPKNSLAGMAPRAKLVSLKVLGGGGTVEDRVSRVIRALAYVREVNATSDKLPRIHGVNLSVGYEFDPTWFACGRSPLCQEVDKLVRTGVVVVVAAGNSGYGTLNPTLSTVAQFGLGMTINDPGNAERAITVGATHRDMPHAYGVSYFSSKGPTGDGRRKPDLVAPGERITSAAAGALRAAVVLDPTVPNPAVYVEETGTSMAAPHVSGAVASFLSVRREFIGRPEEVKRIFVDSAIPLGRDPNFEGGGLVDLMRALQSV